jgi:hypothetical protein
MKKLLLHIILLSYAIVMFKPAFPYVEDFIGHVMFYKHHMATVHFENGKYHVHAEVAKNTKEENSNKNSSSLKKLLSSSDHIVVVNKTFTCNTEINSQNYSLPSIHDLPAGKSSYNYPPPRI